ncbi:hypothetical protein [Nocardia noduli]|uniref:hypothetical protein n=1 Tax=Nocardia noduli TaxID=2815722 RepID=UPI001C2166E6|nr:hypothetical protein [Nocardia noduli]
MGADKTLQNINDAIQAFADKVEEVKNTPDDVDKAFRLLAVAMSSNEGNIVPVIGPIVGGIAGWFRQDDFSGTLSSNKDEIKAKIRELLQDLHDGIEAMKAPVAFLQTSGDWLVLQTKIGEAQNDEVDKGNLSGYWKGAASLAYLNSRIKQDTALDSAKAICGNVQKSLVSISNAAWTFYSDMAAKLTDFLVKFATALTKISTLIESPWGISDAIDLLGSIITEAVSIGTKLTTALLTEYNVINEITAATQNPKGFFKNKWPQSTSTDFDRNSQTVDWTAE